MAQDFGAGNLGRLTHTLSLALPQRGGGEAARLRHRCDELAVYLWPAGDDNRELIIV